MATRGDERASRRPSLIIDSEGTTTRARDTRGRTINEPSVYNLALSGTASGNQAGQLIGADGEPAAGTRTFAA